MLTKLISHPGQLIRWVPAPLRSRRVMLAVIALVVSIALLTNWLFKYGARI
jgi:hypothetical protein